MGYCSIKRIKEFLPFVTWMNLEDTKLNEVNKSEKDEYCMISLTRGVSKKSTSKKQKVYGDYKGWEKLGNGQSVQKFQLHRMNESN